MRRTKTLPAQYRTAFFLVVSLFMLWAVAHSLNDVLIRQFQKALGISRGQAGMIQFSFYLAYPFAALPAGLAMKKLGFKAAIVSGLGLYALGALLFYPAAELAQFEFFLAALFVLACGVVFLETSGSGYITLTAPRELAVQRINFAQSFNGMGAVLGPVIGGLFIFSGQEYGSAELAALSPAELAHFRRAEVEQVQIPYLSIALVVLVIAVLVAVTPFRSGADKANLKIQPTGFSIYRLWSNLAFRHAAIAQFFYVGAQIGVLSFFIDFVTDTASTLSEKAAAALLSASLVGFMIGRFVGTFLLGRIQPATLLAIYAFVNVGLLAIVAFGLDYISIAALCITGFFMSIMFPTIFALGVQDLGRDAEIGSSIIIMTIISGAFIPPCMGFLADAISIQVAYVVPLLCFVIVLAMARRLTAENEPALSSGCNKEVRQS